jgi:hypothetical protein
MGPTWNGLGGLGKNRRNGHLKLRIFRNHASADSVFSLYVDLREFAGCVDDKGCCEFNCWQGAIEFNAHQRTKLPLLTRKLAVNPRQLSLLVVLALIRITPAFAADRNEQGAGWRTSTPEVASSTLSGNLYRNSADQNGAAPYVLLDRFGVVRGYVAAAQGVDLEASVGRQVSLQGSIKTLPGGDMPYLVCHKVLGGDSETANRPDESAKAAPKRRPAATFVEEQPREVAPQPELPTRDEMSAEPEVRTAALPLQEVVLEPQPADGNSQQPYSPRRSRRVRVQATNYQETLPTPAAVEIHREPMTSDAELEPTPMSHGPMVSEGPMTMSPEGPMVSEGPMVGPGRMGCDTCNDGSCGSPAGCDADCDIPCWGPRRPIFCIGPTGIWVKADYLQWWEQGTHLPPLATTGPSAAQPGILDQPGTQVLFGGNSVDNKSVGGGRIQAGLWLNACATFGFEGEYFQLADESTNYYLWSNGNPIISRPFNDTNPANLGQQVENVALPRGNAGSVDGAINIGVASRLQGAGAHFLFTLCRQEGCWTDDCSCTTYHDRFRADFIAGYRYLDLEDQLGITETLTSTTPVPIDPTNPTGAQGVYAYQIHDQFNTQNLFNGGDLGMKFEFVRNRWSLDVYPRIALGTTHSTVDISGMTQRTSPDGTVATAQGGLLTQSGPGLNIGHYTEDVFAVVPQIGLNLGYQFTTHTKVVFGYDFLYWSKVARAGEQIDTNVNSTLLPFSPTTQAGTTHPQFSFQETGFWAQGFNVGVDLRW